jgi:hypothetical protein
MVRHLCIAVVGALVAAGTATVIVVGTAAPAFAAAPTITAVNTLNASGAFSGPAFGTWQGSVAAQVTGTGFTTTADTTVHYGALAADPTSIHVISPTTLLVSSPNAGSGAAGTTVDITVTNSGGTSAIVAADHWTNSNCTFNSQIAGAVIGVTPGVSSLAVNCAALGPSGPSASYVMALTSPVLAAQPPGPICIACDESFIMNNSAGLPPSVSSTTGALTVSLPVPQKTSGGNPSATGSATDGDGISPVTQYQVNQGLQADAFAVANLGGVNFGNALLEYPGQPTPQVPTLTLSSQSSTVGAGTTVTASGTGWWGIGTGNNTIPAANVHVGGVAATTANLTVTPPEYGISCNSAAAGNGGACTGTLTPSTLTGTFVVPAGIANNTVTIDQPNTPPTPCTVSASVPTCFVGNGPGGTVEGTASLAGVPQATATATGIATWNNNGPNNAVTNSVNPPDPNVFWQPTSAIGANPVTYDVNLGAATTVSAVTADWQPDFGAPSAYTIATSPDGTTYTTQATVTGNTSRVRTDVFTGGAVTGVTHIRLVITTYEGAGTDPYAHLALVQLGWDGHGAVFPRAISPNTTVFGKNVPQFAVNNPQDPNVFWQPTSAAASGAIYEVDLGSSTTVSSISTTWFRGFPAPSAYTIDTSPDGVTWTTRVTVSGNTAQQRTDVFPGGQVSASYVRLVLTTFQTGLPDTYAHVALVQFNVNGAESQGVGRGVIDGGTGYSAPTHSSTGATTTYTANTATDTSANYTVNQWAGFGVKSGVNFGTVASNTATTLTLTANWSPATPTNATAFTIGPSFTANTATDLSANWVVNQWAGATAKSGANSCTVASNTATALTCSANWAAATPVNGTSFNMLYPAACNCLVTSATANFTQNDVGALFAGPNGQIPVPAYVGAINLPTLGTGNLPSISLSSSPTANIPLAATAAATGMSAEIESVPGATPTGCTQLASCATSLFPQAYYPAFVGTSATANTTATYNGEVPNNAFSGGNDPGSALPTVKRIISGNATCCVVTSGTNTITAASATFSATNADVGRPVSGVGVALGAIVTAETTTQLTVSINSTATNSAVSISFGGTSWWQPVGNATQAGNPQVVGVDFGFPRTVSSVTAHWLDSSKCPGGAGITCTGFEATAYTILTSPDGVTWTTCATVTTNAAFTVTDTCSASGVQYLEYDITAWNAPTPYQGYGPALNTLLIS